MAVADLLHSAAQITPVFGGLLAVLGAIIAATLTFRQARAAAVFHQKLAEELRQQAADVQTLLDGADEHYGILQLAVEKALSSLDQQNRDLLKDGFEQPSKIGRRTFVTRHVKASQRARQEAA